MNYTMTPSQPGYTAITGAGGETNIPNFGFCPDQTVSPVIPIGFTFQFDGTNYTQVVATDNGIMIFGNNAALSNCGGNAGNPTDIPNDLSDVSITRPFVAPLWEELQFKPTSPFGSGCYKTTGPVGSRTFTLEWCKMSWRAPSNGDQISFQVVLFEGSNIIDFNYLQGASAIGTFPTASIGLGAIAPGTYYSLNNSSAAPTSSSTVNTQNIATKPATGQRYRWTPISGAPIQLISFTGENVGKENVLHWSVATQTINDYFTLLHSPDGVSYSEVTRVDGAGTTSQLMEYSAIDDSFFSDVTYYRLKWTDFNGRSEYSNIIALENSIVQPTAAILYPNPTSTVLNIQNLSANTHYIIFDLQGKIIREGELEKSNPVIDISEMSDGIYFLEMGDDVRHKVVICH